MPPCSYLYMCDRSPTMASCPRPQWVSSETRLPIVPLATNSASSLPRRLAASSWSLLTVGSSPNTSSPSSALCMASRMAWLGNVTVSLRKSIRFILACHRPRESPIITGLSSQPCSGTHLRRSPRLTVCRPGKALPQRLFHDLAAARLGQLVQEVDGARRLVSSQPCPHEAHELVGGHPGGWSFDDGRLHNLSPLVVRNAENRAFEHRLVLVQNVLHLRRIDVLAAGEDHVLFAIHDVDVAFGVNYGQVARVEPAVPYGLRRGFRSLPVARRDGGPAHDDLADLPIIAGHLAAVRADHFQIDAQERAAGAALDGQLLCRRAVFQVILQPAYRQIRARFRHAVSLHEIATEGRHDLSHGLGSDWRAAAQEQAQARIIMPSQTRVVKHGVEHGRNEIGDRHLLLLDDAQHLAGMEVGNEHVPGSDPGGGERRPGVGQVKHGSDVSPAVRVAQPYVGNGAQGVEGYVAVREHHSFGTAGGATRVIQLRQIVRLRLGKAGHRPRMAGQKLLVSTGIAAGRQPPRPRVQSPCARSALAPRSQPG